MPVDAGDDRHIHAAESAVGTDDAGSIADEFLSVLASNWVTAMEPHLAALAALASPSAPEAHEVSHPENAHAVAVATMLAFALESNAGRLAALGRVPADTRPDAGALEIIKEVLAENRQDPGPVIELFVLRDVIVHDHIWEIRLRRAPDWSSASLVSAELRRGRTSGKYADVVVDEGTNRTSQLRLHLVPTEVRRWDIARLFPAACAAFDALAARDVANMRSLADQRVRIPGHRPASLRDVVPFLQVQQEDRPQ